MSPNNSYPKIVYIAGTGRNGSTLIGNILAEHPDVVSVGELKFLWRNLYFGYICGCGVDINSCGFWNKVIREAFGSLSKNDLKSLMRSTENITRRFGILNQNYQNAELMELGKSFKSIYAAVRSVSQRNVIVDGSKTPLFEKFLLSNLLYPVYTIHLVRDPRATCYSWNIRKDTPDPSEPSLPQLGVASTAFKWVVWNLFIEIRKNKNYLRLLYEDWAENPHGELDAITRFANLKQLAPPLFNGKMVNLGVHHTVSGNPARFRQGLLEIKVDERWKQSMPLFQKFLVMIQTWPLFVKYYLHKRNDATE